MARPIDVEVLQKQAVAAAALLHVFANKNRLKLICALYRGEKSVNDLAAILGTTQSNVSQHLAHLRRHSLVRIRWQGASRYYSLVEHPVHDVLRTLYESVPPTLD